jgi:hypothetical protein
LPGDAGDTLAVLAVSTAATATAAAAAAVAGAFADDVFVVALPTVAANTDSQRKKTNQSLSLIGVGGLFQVQFHLLFVRIRTRRPQPQPRLDLIKLFFFGLFRPVLACQTLKEKLDPSIALPDRLEHPIFSHPLFPNKAQLKSEKRKAARFWNVLGSLLCFSWRRGGGLDFCRSLIP